MKNIPFLTKRMQMGHIAFTLVIIHVMIGFWTYMWKLIFFMVKTQVEYTKMRRENEKG